MPILLYIITFKFKLIDNKNDYNNEIKVNIYIIILLNGFDKIVLLKIIFLFLKKE